MMNQSHDIIIELQAIEGKATLDSMGLVDQRLFTGENKLHAKMDTQSCLWHCEYDNGMLPQPLKQRFTSFNRLLNFVGDYFKRRNIEILRVVD